MPRVMRGLERAQLQLRLLRASEVFVVCVRVVLGPYGWPSHSGMMPPAPQASLEQQAAWALPGPTATPLTRLLGVRTLWLWYWVHLRPGSGLGVWPGLCVRNQGLVCGWCSRPRSRRQ